MGSGAAGCEVLRGGGGGGGYLKGGQDCGLGQQVPDSCPDVCIHLGALAGLGLQSCQGMRLGPT